jgi:serine/threonine-protein kinase
LTGRGVDTIAPDVIGTGDPPLPGGAAPSDALSTGAVFARRYRLVRRMSAGAMADLYEAEHVNTRRRVALKVLHPEVMEDPTAVERFRREATACADIDSEHIVGVIDSDVDPGTGRPFLVMEYLHGRDLAQYIAETWGASAPIPTSQTLLLLRQVASALDKVHAAGIVHRDLKPANLFLVTPDDGPPRVKIVDFGVAKLVRERSGSEGERIGTPLYMAPEQLDGDSVSVDGRADVFALGAILYEVVSLRRLRETAMDVRTGRVRRVSSVVPDVSPELDAICAKATARDPADRYPTARALAEAIESYLDGDQNEALRRELAMQHVTRARDLFARASTAQARVEALREALRAMALDPQNQEAQKLLLAAVTNVPDAIPPEAQESYRHATDGARLRLLRVTGPLWLTWLVVVPLAMVAGVRDWRPLALGAASSFVGACLAWYSARQGVCSTRRVVLLGACAAVTVGASACFLGPFVMPPLCGSTAAVVAALYARPTERRAVTGMVALAVLAAFAVELLGLVSPAWSFRQDQLTLFARVVVLPERMTVWFLLYMSVSFVVLPAVLVGRVRDAAARTERREFMQAWMVRKLFPNDGG